MEKKSSCAKKGEVKKMIKKAVKGVKKWDEKQDKKFALRKKKK